VGDAAGVPNGGEPVKRFALIGAAGFVAPRHARAILATGNHLAAAMDPHDAVGFLDRHALDVDFFSEYERFERHLDRLRRGPAEHRLDYVSICSPNYLHDAHVRLALHAGADAICEKPLVINPWNLDALADIEHATGRRVNTVLQLRLHDKLIALRERLAQAGDRRHAVTLRYVSARGRWYDISWKGSEERSGGVLMNIGIHLFDLLLWLFGGVEAAAVSLREPHRAAGQLELARASVSWFLSTDVRDLPDAAIGARTSRSIEVDGDVVEFSETFDDLHQRVYEEVLAGRGFGIADARPSIELVHRLRHAPVTPGAAAAHAGGHAV
jgi:UDP-N-acetyl-2-amino-2-deoxyglucuronate dehydrogenase